MASNTEVVPKDAVHVGELIISADLDVSFPEPNDLTYLDLPLSIYRTHGFDGERFDVVSSHEPLNGQQLLGFLKEIAPNKRLGETADAVISDWNILDRIQDPNAAFARRLVDLHKQLGSSWAEFAKSQPGFLSTMNAARMPYFDRLYYTSSIASLLPVDETLAERAFGDLVLSASTTILQILDIFQKSGMPDADSFVLGALRSEVNKKRHLPQKSITRVDTMQRRFQSWHPSRKRTFLKGLVSALSDEQHTIVMKRAVDELYDTFEFPDGKEYAYPRSLLKNETLAEAFAKRNTAVDGVYEGQFINLPPKRPGRRDRVDVLIPGSMRRIADGAKISPLISWQRDRNGVRKFVFERQTYIDDGVRFRDGVLGALAVAYFSPDIRAEWPEEMSIGDSRKQFMGAAQIPVLALLRQKQLLKSDFVEATESVVA